MRGGSLGGSRLAVATTTATIGVGNATVDVGDGVVGLNAYPEEENHDLRSGDR